MHLAVGESELVRVEIKPPGDGATGRTREVTVIDAEQFAHDVARPDLDYSSELRMPCSLGEPQPVLPWQQCVQCFGQGHSRVGAAQHAHVFESRLRRGNDLARHVDGQAAKRGNARERGRAQGNSRRRNGGRTPAPTAHHSLTPS